ncbi:MAG: FtsX-like permease family protein [bacterium]
MKIFNESISDIFRHRLTSVLFGGVIAITVFILCIFISVIYNLDSIEKKWSREVRIVAFPSQNADIPAVTAQIKKVKNVIDAVSIQPAAVFELLKKRFPNQEITLSESVLPSMIEIRTDIHHIDEAKIEISKIADIEEVTVNTAWYDNLKNLTSSVKYVSLIVAGLIFCMAALLISYVTKLGVIQRKPEIAIMRFCGATEWYIRKPYVLTGVILGFIGGGLGILFYLSLDYLMQEIIGSFIDTWRTGTIAQMLFVYLLAMLLGAIGNFMAFTRGDEDE